MGMAASKVLKGQTSININPGILRQGRAIAKEDHRSFSSFVESCIAKEIRRYIAMKALDADIAKEEEAQRRRALTKAPRRASTSA